MFLLHAFIIKLLSKSGVFAAPLKEYLRLLMPLLTWPFAKILFYLPIYYVVYMCARVLNDHELKQGCVSQHQNLSSLLYILFVMILNDVLVCFYSTFLVCV